MKEKLPLLIGIGLPILLIIYVGVYTYVPSLFIKPKYNFVYAMGDLYYYNINVFGGKVSVNQKSYKSTTYTPSQPVFYFYDVSNERGTAISLTQAQSYSLDPSSKSPDGFTVTRGDRGSSGVFPLFWFDSYDRGYYLQGKGLNKQITSETYNFKFVGWVLNE